MANMAKIRQSIIFKANEMAKVPLKKAILTKMANLAKIRLCDFLHDGLINGKSTVISEIPMLSKGP